MRIAVCDDCMEDTFLCVLVLVLMLFNYVTFFSSLYRQLLLNRKQPDI